MLATLVVGIRKLAVLQSDWTAKILQLQNLQIGPGYRLDIRPSRFALMGVAMPDYPHQGTVGALREVTRYALITFPQIQLKTHFTRHSIIG